MPRSLKTSPEYLTARNSCDEKTGEAGGAAIHVAAPSTMIWHLQPPADAGDHQRHVTLLRFDLRWQLSPLQPLTHVPAPVRWGRESQVRNLVGGDTESLK